MYTVSPKGPSKIVNKTRRGLNQKLDSSSTSATGGGRLVENRDQLRRSTIACGGASVGSQVSSSAATDLDEATVEMSSPKPVFHIVNGKRSSGNQRMSIEITPQHEDIIKYISEDWNRVLREYETNKQQDLDSKCNTGVVYYQETAPSHLFENFKPFDIDMWWGQRFIQNVTNDT